MTNEHGTLTSDIRPSTLSVVWLAERMDVPLTAQAALARARTWFSRQGIWCDAFDDDTLSFGATFQGLGRMRRQSPWWLSGLVGCRIRARRQGERISVTTEGSYVVLVLFSAAWIALPVVYYGFPPVAAWVVAAYSVVHGWWASNRLKYLAQYATCMVPDETPDDANSIV